MSHATNGAIAIADGMSARFHSEFKAVDDLRRIGTVFEGEVVAGHFYRSSGGFATAQVVSFLVVEATSVGSDRLEAISASSSFFDAVRSTAIVSDT